MIYIFIGTEINIVKEKINETINKLEIKRVGVISSAKRSI